VIRAALSSVMALSLALVLAAGSCLACVKLTQATHSHQCCHQKGGCEQPAPSPASHSHCASAPVDLSAAAEASRPAWNHLELAPIALPGLASIAAPPVFSPPEEPPIAPYSPPDLNLLNSVLIL
jgi:hypothetical protein